MKVFAIATLLGLGFLLALLPFTQGVADRYKVEIDEKGTRFSEEIDVDENGDEAVFRVPSHNNVDGADFYHDFKLLPGSFQERSATSPKSLSSPGKLKEDLDRAASQTGQLPVTTKSNMMLVSGPANKHFLPQKILEFCGKLPIYNVETVDQYSVINGTSGSGIRHRIARQATQTVTRYAQCNRNALAYVATCMKKKWDLSCRMQSHSCYYMVTCINQQPRNTVWQCTEVHLTTDYPVCCDLICPQ